MAEEQKKDGRRKPVDWEAVERLYRAGVMSVRAIAAEHGITEGAIRRKARENGWERDLSAKVAEKVRSDLVREEVRKQKRVLSRESEREIVDAAATAVVQIVTNHRQDIGKARATANALLAELQAANEPELQALIAEAGKALATASGDATLEQLVRKAMSLNSRAGTLQSLVNSLKTLVGLEREAYNIQSMAETGDSFEDRLKAIHESV